LNEIIATADDFSATLIAIGESSPSVTTNDTLNGAPVTIGTSPGDVSLTGVTVPTGLTLNADGTILVEDLTPSGTYNVVYEICEYGASPVNCDQATVTVTVFNYIDAIDDNSYAVQVASTTATSTVGTVTSNDTINDLAVTTTNTDVTPITTGSLSIDSEGVLSLEPNTTTGTYSITYELCETGAGPANCDTATATVEVLNEIEAVDDGLFTIVVAVVGDLSGGNVLENDTLNGVLVTNANTDVTPVVSGPLSVDSNGNVTIASNALDGTYSITYELCETGADPANCDTAVATYAIITDSDGDGVINIDEITDGTDPYDFCDYIPANITLDQSEAFLEGDCDEDGLSNGDEVGANPLAPFDSNGDGIPDFLEVNNHNLSNSDDDLEIFNGFSPSSDDPYNRVFTIRNIELYPNNTLEIYNRWGVLVYQTKGYGQSGKYFDGTSEGRVNVAVNEKLPSGTYFYVLRYVNSEEVSKERAGYLYINR
jgi:gliding motility-associated-like protein